MTVQVIALALIVASVGVGTWASGDGDRDGDAALTSANPWTLALSETLHPARAEGAPVRA